MATQNPAIIAGIAGEDLLSRECVTLNSSGEFILALADDSGDESPPIGFILQDADGPTAQEEVLVQVYDRLSGFLVGTSGLIPGATYFLSSTIPGGITPIKPPNASAIVVGVAEDEDTLFILNTPRTSPDDIAKFSSAVKNFAFFETSKPYKSETSATYADVATWRFPGGTQLISVMKCVVGTGNAGNTMDVRCFDLTNNNIVAEITGITFAAVNTTQIEDMGTVSNLPSLEAVFAIQIRKATGGSEVRIYEFDTDA